MIHNYSDFRNSDYYNWYPNTTKTIYSNLSTIFTIWGWWIMNVQSVNKRIKTEQWMQRIKECQDSGLSIRAWCEQNNICEQTYYSWLRKLRALAIESGTVSTSKFVPIDQIGSEKENIIITRGSIRIEFPSDTDIETITRMIEALLC